MNILFYIKKIGIAKLSRFGDSAKRISEKTGKNYFLILADICASVALYGSGHVDYETFEFYNKSAKERSEILTIGKNHKIFKAFNQIPYMAYFEDKAIFNRKFEKYLKRDWMLVGEGILYGNIKKSVVTKEECVYGKGLEDFKTFLKGKEYVIVKPLGLSCGEGIEKIKTAERNAEELYDYLVKNGKPLVEEVVDQDEQMNLLSRDSVNTVRVVTITKNGVTKIVSGGVRMGKPGAFVDNFNSGGISTIYDKDTGVIISDGYDKERNTYVTAPKSGVAFKGFQIPAWNEIVELVEDACKVVPEIGYVGWDVCVSKDKGPLLIEGNSYPAQDLSQEPSLNAGTYTAFKEAIKQLK